MVRQYRADIDGLRALAVGGVVLFHAFPHALPGGFIGVDVFFVLSGFLITAIIRSEAEANSFSLAGFYERRFRRIVPALAAMVLATTIVAVVILPPTELRGYGKSLIGVAVFASNMIFWRDSGYFDTASADKPLLHTWSLAVEEQFYILWPLIAVALVRLGRRRSLVVFVWATVIVSLGAAIWAVSAVPSSAFYLLPYRAWELGFGALLAVGAIPAIRSAALREAAAITGLLLIAVPMAVYSEQTPFPGLAAVPPCLGTLLLIHAGQGYATGVGRVLSLRPILYVGLTSYSFYLWHWPLLVLPRIALTRELHVWEAALAVAAAFALAAGSLHYVERPFRGKGGFALTRRRVLVASVVCFAVLGTIGGGLVASNGLWRFASPGTRYAENAVQSVNPLRARCHNDDDSSALVPIAACTAGAPGPADRYDVLVWGDSHADHLVPGLVAAGRRDGFRLRQGTISGCSPTVLLSDRPDRRACRAFHEAMLAEATRQPSLRAVVLSGRWQKALTGFAPEGSTPARYAATYRDVLQRTLAEIRQRLGPNVPIILIANTPEFDFWPAMCVARRAKTGSDLAPCLTSTSRDSGPIHVVDGILKSLEGNNVHVVDIYDYFCNRDVCRTGAGGEVYFRDDDHLSNEGSAFVARAIVPYLRRS